MRISDLPDDALLEVFSYLPMEDLVRVSMVCRRLNAVVDDYIFKRIASMSLMTPHNSFEFRQFQGFTSNWDRIQVDKHWRNNLYLRRDSYHHKLGANFKMHLDKEFLYLTNRGEIRLHQRTEENFKDDFIAIGREKNPAISAIRVDSNGVVFSGSLEGTANVYVDRTPIVENFKLNQDVEAVRFVDFHMERNVFVTASHLTAKEWCLETELGLYDLRHTNSVSSDYITCLKLAPSGQKYVRGSSKYKLILRDLETGSESRLIDGDLETVLDVLWTLDERLLFSGNRDGSLRVFDLRTGRVQRVLDSTSMWNISLDYNGLDAVLCGYQNMCVSLYDLRMSESVTSYGPFNDAEPSSTLNQIACDTRQLHIALSYHLVSLNFS